MPERVQCSRTSTRPDRIEARSDLRKSHSRSEHSHVYDIMDLLRCCDVCSQNQKLRRGDQVPKRYPYFSGATSDSELINTLYPKTVELYTLPHCVRSIGHGAPTCLKVRRRPEFMMVGFVMKRLRHGFFFSRRIRVLCEAIPTKTSLQAS